MGPLDALDVGIPLIELKAVSKRYAREHAPAVRKVNLAIARGAFVSIVGHSGSGKTTLLKMINRLVEPEEGCVWIAGSRTRSVPAYALRRLIGYVFQEIGLFPHLSVAENIAITPRLLGWPERQVSKRVREVLDFVALPQEHLTRMPAQLSGGQRQRVGVARALAAGPAIMLMDEPFGALDPLTRDELARQYREIHARMALTTVMVTHDVTEAVLLSDRIVVMREGTIVADGEPHELLRGSFDPLVQRLMDMPRRQAQRITELIEQRGGCG